MCKFHGWLCSWKELCSLLLRTVHGKNIKAKVRRVVFAASVYHIWLEQNARSHQSGSRDWQALADSIMISIQTWNDIDIQLVFSWAVFSHCAIYIFLDKILLF